MKWVAIIAGVLALVGGAVMGVLIIQDERRIAAEADWQHYGKWKNDPLYSPKALSYDDFSYIVHMPGGVPVDCKMARGVRAVDYIEDRTARCWYELPKFRSQFPEYKDLSDTELSDRLYRKAGIPQ